MSGSFFSLLGCPEMLKKITQAALESSENKCTARKINLKRIEPERKLRTEGVIAEMFNQKKILLEGYVYTAVALLSI